MSPRPAPLPPPTCAGRTRDSEPCTRPAEPGSRYCWQHIGQRPLTPVDYLVETGSALGRAADPVVHLRYAARMRLLCSGSPARDLAGPAPRSRVCRDCRRLALAAVQRGEVEPDTLRRFALGEPNVDEGQR